MLTALTSCILVDRPSHLCELIISNNSDRTFFFLVVGLHYLQECLFPVISLAYVT